VKVNNSTSINLSSSLTEHKEHDGNCGHGMGQIQACGGVNRSTGSEPPILITGSPMAIQQQY
jgi:hypothetical protein